MKVAMKNLSYLKTTIKDKLTMLKLEKLKDKKNKRKGRNKKNWINQTLLMLNLVRKNPKKVNLFNLKAQVFQQISL